MVDVLAEDELELLRKREKEEEQIQKKVTDYMQREQERLKAKNIEIQNLARKNIPPQV